MSTRTSIVKVNRQEAEFIRHKSKEELATKFGVTNPTKFEYVELYEVGRNAVNDMGLPFFTNYQLDEPDRIQLLSKPDLENYIKRYAQGIEVMYQQLQKQLETGMLINVSQFLNSRNNYWSAERLDSTLALDNNPDGAITHAWMYEATIFNMVHILKTLDWDKDYCVMITT